MYYIYLYIIFLDTINIKCIIMIARFYFPYVIMHDTNCLKKSDILVKISACSARYLALKVNITGASCFLILLHRVMLN
jgi:hypothetical protein